jgi:predicted nucleic acid-binding protein
LSIVVDTNVIVAALIQRGIVRELVVDHPGAFLTPESCISEAWENREDWNRKKVPEVIVKEALDFLAEEFISVVPRSTYEAKEAEAAALIRDLDDVPVVSLALAVDNEGIWTFNTKDFATPLVTSRCRILGTAEVKAILAQR